MTRPVNKTRGEHQLTLAGVTYKLCPRYEAIQAIETALGKSLVELSRLGNVGALRTDQVGTIAAELIKAGAEDELTAMVSADEIGNLCYEEGQPHVMAVLTICLVDAATGGRTRSGEARAVAPAGRKARATAS